MPSSENAGFEDDTFFSDINIFAPFAPARSIVEEGCTPMNPFDDFSAAVFDLSGWLEEN